MKTGSPKLRLLTLSMGIFMGLLRAAQAAPTVANPLVGTQWDFATITEDQSSNEHSMKMQVVINSRWSLSETKLKNEVMCRYEKPMAKTLIATTEADISYDAKKSSFSILKSENERQEFKVNLKPKSGKGKALTLSMFCKADINKGSFKYKVSDQGLILDPVVEPLVLKRVSTETP